MSDIEEILPEDSVSQQSHLRSFSTSLSSHFPPPVNERAAYPHLATMVRDILAVPATGAGVERQFSKSGKVETKLRARIEPITTCESMMYTDMLTRKNRALTTIQVITRVEDNGIGSNEEPPPEWRHDWFKGRKNKHIVM